MRVTAVGVSGSFTGRNSPASCYLVRAEHEGREWSVVLDLGNGALGELQRHTEPLGVDAVVLSHLHADHCADICGLYVMARYRHAGPSETRLPIYAPAGAAERLGRMYGVTEPEDLTPCFDFRDLSDRGAFELGPFVITPFQVHHPVESYGFRVEADGETLVYTGDTDYAQSVVELCRNASLVLADAAFVDGRDQAEGVHMSGSRAARAAVEAGGVARLMLTHIPSWNDPEVCRAQAAEVWPGTVELARHGRTYEV